MISNIGDYDRLYKSLIKGEDIQDVTAMFVIEAIKDTTALPLSPT